MAKITMVFIDTSKATTLPYAINIEESAKLGCVVVLDSKTKRKLYFKDGKKFKVGKEEATELIPLSKEELRQIGVEETSNDCFELTIEESSQNEGERMTPEEYEAWKQKQIESQKGVVYHADLGNPESVKHAEEIIKRKKKELGMNDPSDSDLTEAKKLLEDMRQKVIAKAEALNVEITDNQIKTLEDLKATAILLKGMEKPKSSQKVVSGVAPLNPQQISGQTQKQGYDSVQSMVEDLFKRERMGSSEASEIIRTLYEKSFSATNKGAKIPNMELEFPSIEDLTRPERVEKALEQMEDILPKKKKRIHPSSPIKVETSNKI